MNRVSKGAGEAARKRAAVEIIARHERSLRQTARRYSLCVADAEDAYQRALEILLTKAPTVQTRDLVRWMQTVTKHEALAVRRNRERLLGSPPVFAEGGEEEGDWLTLIPTQADGPSEQLERREAIARSREALQALKPAELRALTLLAEGYSYAEIGELTGFSRTKVNRCLAEGRERFRAMLSRSEDGSRCRDLRPLLSAFCDGEIASKEAATLREHLRACAHCRAVMRAYRAAPRAAAALVPAVPASHSMLERAQETLVGLHSRLFLNSGAADSSITQVAAAGGTRGSGAAALAKLLAICAGTAGSAACVAAGVVPAPIDLSTPSGDRAAHERSSDRSAGAREEPQVVYEPAPAPTPTTEEPSPSPQPQQPQVEAAPSEPQPAQAAQSGAIEYTPPPPPTPEPEPSSASPASSSGSAAGEFGP